jgi:hypothetical protein
MGRFGQQRKPVDSIVRRLGRKNTRPAVVMGPECSTAAIFRSLGLPLQRIWQIKYFLCHIDRTHTYGKQA